MRKIESTTYPLLTALLKAGMWEEYALRCLERGLVRVDGAITRDPAVPVRLPAQHIIVSADR